MTTIAYRSGVMASDSQYTGDYASPGQKLFRRRGTVIGFAGDVAAALVFVDWYFDRKKSPPPRPSAGEDQSKWEALVATRTRVEFWDHHLRPVPILEDYAAIGSGAPYAIAAMDAGRSAASAVRIAIRRDPDSGGRVTTMRVSEEP